MRIFKTVRQQIFDGITWYSPPFIRIFSVPEIDATVKDSLRRFSALLDKKISMEIFDTPLHPLVLKPFRYGKLLPHEKIPVRKFSGLWDKFSTE